MRHIMKMLACAVCCAGIAMQACAASYEDLFPAQPDPLVGEYVGRWGAEEEVNPEIAAQVYALGNDRYNIRIVNKLDMRCPVLLEVEAKPKDGKLTFDEARFSGTVDGQIFKGARGKIGYEMKKVQRESPTMGKAAPEGAVVLFNGTNLDAWDASSRDGWEVRDGVLLVTPSGEYLVSTGVWKDVDLHIEFRLPSLPGARGQARGNSGVFFQGTYEVQVLDSFGLEGYYDECGALYKLSAPHVNACMPPLQWQTYDISYRAAKFEGGKVSEYGHITVHQNGVLIHDNQELTWITAWKEKERQAAPPAEAGPIKLQGHDNFVEFRNIWLVNKSGK